MEPRRGHVKSGGERANQAEAIYLFCVHGPYFVSSHHFVEAGKQLAPRTQLEDEADAVPADDAGACMARKISAAPRALG